MENIVNFFLMFILAKKSHNKFAYSFVSDILSIFFFRKKCIFKRRPLRMQGFFPFSLSYTLVLLIMCIDYICL